MLLAAVSHFLEACVRGRLSIVVAGAPGSGKTPMREAGMMTRALRNVQIEDFTESSRAFVA
jgi:Flp pilus assembly CpaF family ATPase